MDNQYFNDQFKELTGNHPLSWQIRLYEKWFARGQFPSVIDLPTGMGKTMVMAIWLIARKRHPEAIPTRLVYVVDRRTVVDQATDLAIGLQRKLGAEKLAISTLRGQLADNREWSADPSRPAIIIGTVDLIGSAMLFSGYRSSYKRRPLEAGLLAQDSLLVLDEAHLSKPFERLLCSISAIQQGSGNPTQVIRMSATGGDATGEHVFTLDTDPASASFDLWSELDAGGQEKNPIKARFEAAKRLTIIPTENGQLAHRLAAEAVRLAGDEETRGKRIVVFVRKPDDARSIAAVIQKQGAKKSKRQPYGDAVEVLTGTMRGLERDELVEKPVLRRFLNGDEDPDLEQNKEPVFLISTSAGEVGFDLNADHMVCDAAPLDSMIQRLGRVNRRGSGDATVILVKSTAPAADSAFDKACIATSRLLRDGMDLSPEKLAAFKQSLTPEQIEEVTSPKPTTVDLTDILLDGWSMTSITERMPGRPEVGPWLRGLEREQAQTTIAWRAELELVGDNPARERMLQAIFMKHPIRPHESLTVNTVNLLEFLKRVPKLKNRPSNLMEAGVAIRTPRGQVEWRTLQQLSDDPRVLFADTTLILPATFGGLDESGMLDAESIPAMRRDDDSQPLSHDVADRGGYEQTDKARSRLRLLIERNENGSWKPTALPGLSIPEDLALDVTYETSKALFGRLNGTDLRVRLVQSIRVDTEGDVVQSLIVLASASAKKRNEDQLLSEHVGAVESEATRIADALHLAPDDPTRIALLFAARWHDEGKKAQIWQVFANNTAPDRPLGKMAQSRDPRSLRGYRHEFGSLLRIHYRERCGTTGCQLPADLDARELALHLIATHHGAGRPHFGRAIYDPFTDAERDTVHVTSIRRFARLQREYGWWRLAWLENLLRCADQLASAAEEVTEIDELDVGAQ